VLALAVLTLVLSIPSPGLVTINEILSVLILLGVEFTPLRYIWFCCCWDCCCWQLVVVVVRFVVVAIDKFALLLFVPMDGVREQLQQLFVCWLDDEECWGGIRNDVENCFVHAILHLVEWLLERVFWLCRFVAGDSMVNVVGVVGAVGEREFVWPLFVLICVVAVVLVFVSLQLLLLSLKVFIEF
jgi:hypothetical protein